MLTISIPVLYTGPGFDPQPAVGTRFSPQLTLLPAMISKFIIILPHDAMKHMQELIKILKELATGQQMFSMCSNNLRIKVIQKIKINFPV
jgi:hypothetical protein